MDALWLMEGAGNDFLVGVGAWSSRLAEDPALAARLCRRHRGIGADGVLALDIEGRDRLRLRYRNADGGWARFCANGTRCAALAAVRLLKMPQELVIMTDWIEIPAEVDEERVRLRLPAPEPARHLDLDAGGRNWSGILIEVGVPHLVVRSDPATGTDFLKIAPELRRHPDVGPDGANVSFYRRTPDGIIGIRSFERGVEGETLCCGSAVVAVGLVEMARRSSDRVVVRPVSGDHLVVEDLGEGFGLTGPARLIAEVIPVEE
jgi:diaminopimelate epimerase